MANTYTTSKIVRLYDQRTPTKLLHPETELSAVVCTSGGLVVIADNDISVPASSVGAVISASGFITEVAGATVQNSYVDAAAVPYAGVRVLDEVTSTNSAALLAAGYVPSVQAVYDFVSGATAGISSWVTGNSYATITYVTNNFISQGAITDWGSATTTSLGVAAFPANKGTTLVGGSVTLTAAPVTPLFASAAASATAGNIGGVVAMNGMGTAGGQITTLNEASPVVPTVRAVSAYIAGFTYATENYVQTHTGINTPAKYVTARGSTVSGGGDAIALGGIRVVMDTGIGVELTGDTAGNIYGIQATGTTFGMVKVPSANGLSVNDGTLSMARASAYDTFYGAANGAHGAVAVLNVLPATMGSEQSTYANSPIVPNGVAVYQFAEKHQASIYTTAAYADGTTAGFGGVKVLTDTTGILDQDIDYNTSAYVLGAKATYQFVSAYVRDNAPSAAALYFGDFAVTSATGTTYNVANGTVWTDGVATGTTVGASNCTVTGNTGTIWLTITSGATFSYAAAPTFGTATTSYPIANVAGSTVVQCQLGPIVVRGRWA